MPLSHAICCRPCLPDKLPGISANDSALAIVSLGCHASSNPGSASLRCESKGGSLVTGKPYFHLIIVLENHSPLNGIKTPKPCGSSSNKQASQCSTC